MSNSTSSSCNFQPPSNVAQPTASTNAPPFDILSNHVVNARNRNTVFDRNRPSTACFNKIRHSLFSLFSLNAEECSTTYSLIECPHPPLALPELWNAQSRSNKCLFLAKYLVSHLESQNYNFLHSNDSFVTDYDKLCTSMSKWFKSKHKQIQNDDPSAIDPTDPQKLRSCERSQLTSALNV